MLKEYPNMEIIINQTKLSLVQGDITKQQPMPSSTPLTQV